MPLRLRLLGPPRLEVDDGSFMELPVDRPASLAYYLMGRGDWVCREELAYLYNPDADETLAFGNLRKLIHRLKQNDWAASIETDQTRLRLMLESDVQDFRRLLAQKQFAQALEVYSGTFLEGVRFPDLTGYEAWLELERQDLAQAWRNAVLEHARNLESNREYTEAEQWLTRLTRVDPLDEDAIQALLRILRATGEQSRAIDVFEHFRTELKRELDADPLEATRALADEARYNQHVIQVVAKHNLPAPTTRFVGRKRELEQLQSLIAHNRLVTLLGLGGIGKTRLSLEIAWAQLEAFRDGVWFVPLAGVTSTDQVVPSIAQAVGLNLSGTTEAKTQLQQYLRGKHLLLVVDNFEHLIEAAILLEELLELVPELHLLMTSRIALELRAETLFDVDGLSFPSEQTHEALETFDAIKLFLERAARLSTNFTVTTGTLEAVAEISRKVQGMPLALELAATWTRSLSPLEVAQALEKDLSLLSTRGRDVPDRHRNIQAVFDYSWARLSTLEQDALARLSVFVDGFTLEAAERVAGAHLPLLLGLINHSLVRRSLEGRFDLHELVRQFANARAQARPEFWQSTQERFTRYFADFLQVAWQDRGRSHQRSLLGIKPELSNVRQAWQWMIQGLGYQHLRHSFEAVSDYFLYFMPPLESQRLFSQSLRQIQARAARSRPEDTIEYTFCLGKLHQCCGLFDYLVAQPDAVWHFERSLESFIEIADKGEQSRTLNYLGQTQMFGGQYAAARKSFVASLELGQGIHDDLLVAQSLNSLGGVSIFEHKYDEAVRHLEPALRIYEHANLMIEAIATRINLAEAQGFSGRFATARTNLVAVIELCRQVEANKFLITAYMTLSRVSFLERNFLQVIATHQEVRTLSTSYFLTGDPYLFIGPGISHRELDQHHESLRVLLDGAQVSKMPHEQLEIMLELAHSLTFVNERPLAIKLAAHCLEFAPNDHLKRMAEDLLCHFRASPVQTEDSMLEPAMLAAILGLLTTVPSPQH
jgi:DNA-binding SARP family transcriptional activator/tetratricopeptide (TPR) repeat protein